ncbi:MAG: CoA ester lyase [Acidobacteriota bacterium]|nr:CoA ester lyase [Acidobacteriota bacterium]
MTIRLRRSELSTPASSEKMMSKAAACDADLVFLDLEDAVAPSEKEGARTMAVEALNSLDWKPQTVAVRVNDAESHWAYEDVITVVEGAGHKIDLLILPKVKAPRDVWFFDTLLEQIEKKLGLQKKIGLEILIEEVEALACVEELARCCPRLEALILGVGDLSASQGMKLGQIGGSDERYPGDIWHFARARLVVAARAAGIDAIDGPYANFRNPDGYVRQASWAAALGFVGKWAIHPSQIELANQVYSPTDEEITEARNMIEEVRKAEEGGMGAANTGGVMIDAATARIFQVIVDRAELMGR